MATAHRPRAKIAVVSDTEVVITRSFDAPARLVYEASTKPEYMKRWYGPRSFTMVHCEIDLRPGGQFFWTVRTPDGMAFSYRGTYGTIDAPRHMTYTEAFLLGDTWTNDLQYDVTLDEHDGQTDMTVRLTYATMADRDAHLASGMEEGMAESHQRLDELLDDLVATQA
jgi:uncharacterized protein YndB with AHSA1/START domain